MPPKKRSAPAPDDPEDDVQQQPQPIQGKVGACGSCRKSRTKCEFLPGAKSCNRCIKLDRTAECVAQKSRTRSIRGHHDSVQPEAGDNHTDNNSKAPRTQKRSRSAASSSSKPKAKQQHALNSDHLDLVEPRIPSSAPMNLLVDPIPEHQFTDDAGGIEEHPSIHQATEIISSLAGMGNDESDEFDEGGNTNIGNISIDSDSGSDELDRALAKSLQKTKKLQPAKKQKVAPVPARKTAKHSKAETDSDDESQDTPSKPIDIQCTIRLPNGTNAPFKISSDVTFNRLRAEIGRKLNRFPECLELQYRLDSDRAKDGKISIHNDEELSLFKARLHDKLSGRVPKKFVVHFEDMSNDHDDQGSSNTGKKAVTSSRYAQDKQKSTTEPISQLSGSARHQELIGELQERWKCKTHSRGPESPVYCFPAPRNDSMCLVLTHGIISMWALEIMSGNGSVEEKPDKVVLSEARQRTRTIATKENLSQPVPSPPQPYGYPQAPLNVFVGSLPNPQAFGTQAGSFFPSNQFVDSQLQVPSLFGDHAASGLYASQAPSSRASSFNVRSQSPLPPAPPSDVPDIVTWFKYLHRREGHKPGRPDFSSLGEIMQSKGFYDITQLSLDYFSLADLADWLGVQIGSAILIMQYVNRDLEAMRSGTWSIPQEQ